MVVCLCTRNYLDSGVVCVLVADEEGSLDGASVGVDEVVAEDLLVDPDVVHIHGPVESQCHHLGNLSDLQVARNLTNYK